MYISEIEIKNFKSINNLKIKPNDKFNVIIGQNNTGKTSILEAILLWKKCYDKCLTVSKKTFYSVAKNIQFGELGFLRISDDTGLFNEVITKKADLEITLRIIANEQVFSLGFHVAKVTSIENAYYQVSYIDRMQFKYFEDLISLLGRPNLSNLVAVSDSKPISNIITYEPYMYKGQIRTKITKGKGAEVLRNKIINNDNDKEKIEHYISTVMGKKVEFIEKDKENKNYIKLNVKIDGKETDILSQGSGFLQIAEIFSSFEFFNAELYILLIDEPDSHVHLRLQKSLINEFRTIEKSQLFVVSHNEKFIEELEDEEILFVNEIDKKDGLIEPLKKGAKKFVIENLVGTCNDIDRLKLAERILFVEGFKDKERIELLIRKYCDDNSRADCDLFLVAIDGIDTLTDKLPSLIKAYSELIAGEIEWLLLRDTDCIPRSKQNQVVNDTKSLIHHSNKDVIFQPGYEFESVLVSDVSYFVSLINRYYEHTTILNEEAVVSLNQEYVTRCTKVLDDVYLNLSEVFQRQKETRKERYLKTLTVNDYLKEIDVDSIEYIMSKSVLDMYLKDIHNFITAIEETNKPILTSESLVTHYFNGINENGNYHPFHIALLERILP